MVSGSGRHVIAYNGEIYNHLELRELLGNQSTAVDWRGHSDTETLVECFDAWGLDKNAKILARALQKYGMFLGDNGGAMALQVQLLASTPAKNFQRWESLFPGLYKNIKRIPTDKFRVIYTGEPVIKK